MPYLWMLIGSFFFAIMGLLTESLADEYSFAWIGVVRSAVAALLAGSLVIYYRGKFLIFRPAMLWMRSLAGCTAMLCLYFALTHYEIAVVLSLSSMFPIWVAIFGRPLLGTWPSRETWVALAISTVGMWVIYSSATSSRFDTAASAHYVPQLAIPLAVLASMFSAVALLGLNRLGDSDSRAVVTHFSAVSTVISLAAWATLPQSQEFLPSTWGSEWRLLAVGVTAMFGQLFLTKAFSVGIPSKISVVGLSQVAFAAGYKWITEGQVPSTLGCIGMLMILGSTAWFLTLSSDCPQSLPSTQQTEGRKRKAGKGVRSRFGSIGK